MWEGGWESKSREDIGIFGLRKPNMKESGYSVRDGPNLTAYVVVAVRWGDPGTQGK